MDAVNILPFERQQGMSEKETCDHYLKTNGKNTGCTFGRQELQLFSNLFVCVTGFPGMDPIRPSYFTFQLQNIGETSEYPDCFILKWYALLLTNFKEDL